MRKRIERLVIDKDIAGDYVPDFINKHPYTPHSIGDSISDDVKSGMDVIVIDHGEEIIYVE